MKANIRDSMVAKFTKGPQVDSTGRRLRTGMLIRMDSGFPDEDLQLEWWSNRKMWVAKRLPPHDPTPQNVMGLKFTIVRLLDES